ncbi:MAG: uroporphyrinogen-III C-methyltransferase [Methylococcales bacterium]|nr:uroporphyrinogen-III C-methyltransferase [Methylococcales bacterium]
MGKTVAEKVTEEKQQKDEIVTEHVTVAEKKSNAWIGSVLIVLLIVIITFIGFYFLQQLGIKQDDQQLKIGNENLRIFELTKQLNSIQSQLASTQSQLTSVDADVTDTDNVFNKRLSEFSKRNDEKLEATHADLRQTILRLQRQLGKTRGDWLMADAEYLLSVANQRLYLMDDLNTSHEALTAADQRLRESGDAAAFKVREQIAKEIASLKEITVNDVVGSYARLQLLIEKVGTLTLILPYAAKPLVGSKVVSGHKEGAADTHSLTNQVLKQLDGYATIRHSDHVVDKILTAEEAKLIKQQLSIKLEMIKITLVQKNKSLYETSVHDALNWLKLNFTQNKSAKFFVTELNQLNKIQVHAKLPDISLSLKMLRDITKLRIETDKALQADEDVKKATELEQKLKKSVVNPSVKKPSKTDNKATTDKTKKTTEPVTPEKTTVTPKTTPK